jgi:hypothetical protein
VKEHLRARLLSFPDVLAWTDRIFWGEIPQGAAYPNAILYQISGAEGMTLRGPNGLASGRVQLDCHALVYNQAEALSRGAVKALHGYRDETLRLVEHVATRDGREGGSNEAERPFRISLDFIVNWRT